jgi:hypothetical protein
MFLSLPRMREAFFSSAIHRYGTPAIFQRGVNIE